MPSSDIPIIDAIVLLEKFSGKGGWTYAALPGVKTIKSNPFGWQKVRGFIDDFPGTFSSIKSVTCGSEHEKRIETNTSKRKE